MHLLPLFLLILLQSASASVQEPLPESPQMLCPAPRTVLLVKCPRRDQITGNSMSCKQKNRIDDCAHWAQGEGK